MIETNYDYDSDYHSGTVVEQDALAFLGVFKTIDDVPDRYRLTNFKANVDAIKAWNEFDAAELTGLSAHSRRYVYGKAWREWRDYCDRNCVNAALADPQDIEEHLAEQRAEMGKLKTVHDTRFRPLYRWYRWMQFHADYPHRYSPVVMAVLLDGTVHDVWETRLFDRTNIPETSK